MCRWAESFRISFASTKRNHDFINKKTLDCISKKKKMDDVAGLWDEGRPKIVQAWMFE
jgi:hypothetical protein